MRKIILIILLINSFFLSGFISKKRLVYNELKKADKLFNEKRFDEALELYKNLLDKNYYLDAIKERVNFVKYQQGKYEEIDTTIEGETITQLFFLGNVLKKQGDAQEDVDEKVKKYKRALTKYKLAMKLSEDKNIRKNYELVDRLLQELKQKQDKQKQDNEKDKSSEKQTQENQQTQKQKNESQKNDSNNENAENDSKKQENQGNSNKQDNESEQSKENDSLPSQKDNSEQNSNQGQKEGQTQEIDEKQLEEILYHLKKLEMSEKEDLKNNQKVLRAETDNKSKNW